METLLRELAEDIKFIEKYNQSMDSASWGYEEGILITGNDAKEILKHTTQLQADKAELLEALEIFFPMFTELDSEFGIENPPPRKWTETETATVQKLFDLIQKHKQ